MIYIVWADNIMLSKFRMWTPDTWYIYIVWAEDITTKAILIEITPRIILLLTQYNFAHILKSNYNLLVLYIINMNNYLR